MQEVPSLKTVEKSRQRLFSTIGKVDKKGGELLESLGLERQAPVAVAKSKTPQAARQALMDRIDRIQATVHDLAQPSQEQGDKNAEVRQSLLTGTLIEQIHEGTLHATAELRAALVPLLQDQDVGGRLNAARALGRIVEAHPKFATERLKVALVRLLQDPSPSVRIIVELTLRRMCDVGHDLFPAD
ncbi:MAG: hypothetical protein LBM19_04195 [Holosporales bacterium]|jgi:hypothetical protein|nr:hypothetical protein [Holosporales bacterium]